jgi:uncharacterized protein with FMN-binding domain
MKFISKRLKNKKLDSIMGKIHCKCGGLMLVLLLAHIISSISLLESRPFYIYAMGAAAVLCALAAFGSYYFRNRLGKKWLSLHRAISCLILVLVIGHIGGYLASVDAYQNQVSRIQITNVDLSRVPDGVYQGEYDVKYIYAKVNVTVSRGVITDVTILQHRNERGSAAEGITKTMVKEQKINVDAVSGATNSSKVIEKAVENALENGIKIK